MDFTVFLDRDGVVNQDSPLYIKSPEEFLFIPNSPEAVAALTRAGIRVILITNQSVIGRSMVTPQGLDAIFQKMRAGVETAGGQLHDIFFCPHVPDEGCDCRKPAPGMILAAAKKHGIDLTRSCMVGDSAKDILCGRNAGCGATVLVQTGNGKKAAKELAAQGVTPDHTAPDLAEAVPWILDHAKG